MSKQIILISICTVFLTYSCCTSKDCGYEEYPSIKILLIDFPAIIIDNSTNQIIDSIHVDLNSSATFNSGISHTFDNDMRGKTFIIKTNKPSIDTITNVIYEINTFMNNCNNCFLADGGAEATDYSNLQYTLNGTTYYDSEEIKIYY